MSDGDCINVTKTSQEVLIIHDGEECEQSSSSCNDSSQQPCIKPLPYALNTATCSIQADSAKQPVFTDVKVVSSKSCSSTEVSDGDCIVTKTSQEVLIIHDEEGEMSSSSWNDSSQQPCTPSSSAMKTATTRAEIAAIKYLIPLVSPSRSSSASLPAKQGVNKPFFTDPFTLIHRPCEAIIKGAEQLLTDERTKGSNSLGITIQGLGQFSENGLSVLERFAIISEIKHRVAAEARWLSLLNCTNTPLEQANQFSIFET